MVISLSSNLVYIAPFTGFSQNSFVTTARIYKDGNFTTTTEISGTFITGASLDLTLAGTGDYTTGTVTLAYSDKNSVAPLVFATESWTDFITSQLDFSSNINLDIITGNVAQIGASIRGCDATVVLNSVIAEQVNRLRDFSAASVTGCNDMSQNGSTAEGYMTTFDNVGTDDRLLFVWFNDLGVLAASLEKLP